jgi:hypothetical protein
MRCRYSFILNVREIMNDKPKAVLVVVSYSFSDSSFALYDYELIP